MKLTLERNGLFGTANLDDDCSLGECVKILIQHVYPLIVTQEMDLMQIKAMVHAMDCPNFDFEKERKNIECP